MISTLFIIKLKLIVIICKKKLTQIQLQNMEKKHLAGFYAPVVINLIKYTYSCELDVSDCQSDLAGKALLIKKKKENF